MRGGIPTLTHTSSWGSAWLSTGYVFMAWYLVKTRHFTLPYSRLKV